MCRQIEEPLQKLLKSFSGKRKTKFPVDFGGALKPSSNFQSDCLPSRGLVHLNEWKIADAHFASLNCLKRLGIKAWKLPIWSARFEGLEKSAQIMFLPAQQLLEGRKLPWLLPISAWKHQFQPRRRKKHANESTTFAAVTVAKRSTREQKSGMQMKRLFPHLNLLADMRCFVAAFLGASAARRTRWKLNRRTNYRLSHARASDWVKGWAPFSSFHSETRSIQEIPLCFSDLLINRVSFDWQSHAWLPVLKAQAFETEISRKKSQNHSMFLTQMLSTYLNWLLLRSSQPFQRICRFFHATASLLLAEAHTSKAVIDFIRYSSWNASHALHCKSKLERNFFSSVFREFPFND